MVGKTKSYAAILKNIGNHSNYTSKTTVQPNDFYSDFAFLPHVNKVFSQF
jgi:hypothetical protein